MNGGAHFVIGAATAGLGLWGAQKIGVPLESGTILAGALIAGIGSLVPDIDHPRSTISRGFPTELLYRGLLLLLIPVAFAVFPLLMGDFHSASTIFQSLSRMPFIQWGLMLAIPALVLIAASAAASMLFGHRGATHSLVFAVGATCMVAIICIFFNIAWWYSLLFGWGWLLHLLADATTEMGLPALFWPFSGEDELYRQNLMRYNRRRKRW
jgi:membrane-bound metal-dependent hydrolase YbcI (DUF457 family)